ncbi:MAG: amino acid adenylation domain-containing protein [Gemmatimonadales bacterium]
MSHAYVPLTERLAQIARDRPEATAVEGAAGITSFGELWRRASDLAHVLRNRVGHHPEKPIGICLPRSTDMIVAILGVLASRCCYVPLDPGHPAARLRAVLADSGASLVLGYNDTTSLLGVPDSSVLQPWEWIGPLGSDGPQPEADDLAYLIYTSGSTGNPKGVIVEHGAMVNYLNWCLMALPAGGGGVPLFAPLTFDHAVTCIYPPLLVGEPVFLLPPLRGGSALAAGLLTGRCYSFIKITPSHLRLLDLDQRALLGRSTELVMLGGEPSSTDLVAELRRDTPELRIMNHYGPTEATVGCCVYLVPSSPEPGPLPIGQPIPGCQVQIAGEQGDVLSSGEAGELWISGRCLARGYWRRPDLTSRAFVEQPHSVNRVQRWYRTGDIACQRPDGEIVLHGRLDDQVKILGHRAEPTEIEAAIITHPDVDCVLVRARSGLAGTELTAYVATRGNDSINEQDLRQQASSRLPAALVPTTWLQVAEIPLTPNGKVNRRAPLPEGQPAYPPPGLSVESVIAARWRRLLELDAIGLDDDFFDLGGDSLTSVELVTWASAHFGVELELACVFEHPTIRTFSCAVRDAAENR